MRVYNVCIYCVYICITLFYYLEVCSSRITDNSLYQSLFSPKNVLAIQYSDHKKSLSSIIHVDSIIIIVLQRGVQKKPQVTLDLMSKQKEIC